ncbi:helix-turn-helix domain-containing protein [Anoxybacillus ayderensis]|uniref:helix-turn-helix domain-containing protein n=1 Tax=Anoxybacillus ayderensis TaxID=265546 RepID=UPI002E219366|nr:helix-turn-helix domain-containing protein [Anoxybacillus ayderensis]
MLMFKEKCTSRDSAFHEAIEKVFEMIEGAYEWDLDSFDNIYPIERREISLTNEEGEHVGRVMIEIYPFDEEGEYIVEAYLMDGNISPLHLVYTAREAEELWGLGQNTVVKWIERGKLRINECRKSKGTWLVTHKGMERVTGRSLIKKEEDKVNAIFVTNGAYDAVVTRYGQWIMITDKKIFEDFLDAEDNGDDFSNWEQHDWVEDDIWEEAKRLGDIVAYYEDEELHIVDEDKWEQRLEFYSLS